MISRAVVILVAILSLFGAGFGAASPDAAAVAADSERGAALFETLACVQCHRVNGKGGPEMARLIAYLNA